MFEQTMTSRNVTGGSGPQPEAALFELMAEAEFEISPKCTDSLTSMGQALHSSLGFDEGGAVLRLDELVEGLATLHGDDVHLTARVGPPVLLPNLERLPQMSNHSRVNVTEWARQKIIVESQHGEDCFNDSYGGPSVTFYHGTIGYCAERIMNGGGFIAGENGHTKGKTHFKGCFGSKQFDEACYRSDPTRLIREDGIYDFASCPVVCEFTASHWQLRNFHRRNKQLVVLPGNEGALLPGLRLQAVYWNMRLVRNYLALQDPALRADILRRGGVRDRLCGTGRQFQDFRTCGAVLGEYGSNSCKKLGKNYVCEHCYNEWR